MDGWTFRLVAATRSNILYLFGQGNPIFIREKPGNSVATMSNFVNEICAHKCALFSIGWTVQAELNTHVS